MTRVMIPIPDRATGVILAYECPFCGAMGETPRHIIHDCDCLVPNEDDDEACEGRR